MTTRAMTRYKKIVGEFGESLARDYLKRHGYIILDSNKKLGSPEIDIIAKYKKEIVFVEVKTRTSAYLGYADEALRSSQIKTLKKAICIYCSRNKTSLARARLDFISVDINKEAKTAKIKHYKNII